jgi:hypothetical protein
LLLSLDYSTLGLCGLRYRFLPFLQEHNLQGLTPCRFGRIISSKVRSSEGQNENTRSYAFHVSPPENSVLIIMVE